MNDLLDELNEILQGKMYDGYIAALCIYHQDTNASMFIYPDRWRCASCGKSGNTSQLFHQLKSNIIPNRPRVSHNNPQPRNPITRWINVYGSLAKAMQIAHKQLMNRPSVYLTEQRKITQETCKALGIGMLDSWITFPIFDTQHRVIGCTIRIGGHAPYRLYMLPKGQNPNLLFDTDPKRTAQAKEVYLCYGILDAVTLWQIGKAAISTTTGKRLDASALDHIRKPIIITPDVGEEKEAQHLASKLDWRGKVKSLPADGEKDINAIWSKNPQALYSFIGV